MCRPRCARPPVRRGRSSRSRAPRSDAGSPRRSRVTRPVVCTRPGTADAAARAVRGRVRCSRGWRGTAPRSCAPAASRRRRRRWRRRRTQSRGRGGAARVDRRRRGTRCAPPRYTQGCPVGSPTARCAGRGRDARRATRPPRPAVPPSTRSRRCRPAGRRR